MSYPANPYSLTTTKTTAFLGTPNAVAVYVTNTGTDSIDVYLNAEAVSSGGVPPGVSLPFTRRTSGNISKLEIAARTSTTTAEVSIIY